ncbi:hypothetical protein U6A24_09490 [Aquimarina gracilis]|uniref:Phage terminase small subunit n=1 Tax=Aquimarina gracilis TaxID=874422 RepID=A0ABU5ZVA5_9FLAO|nr:hypothetical protein [Aquimarina gracilis]MEB3345693.1 hypothetical protein [Aquimarina gracilis]
MGKKRPEKCISIEEAKDLQKNWCNTRTPEIDRCIGFEDTREFWWSVEELMDYLKYVKRKSRKMGIDDPGIRLYFGAYPSEKCKMKRGYATAFLAPTGAPAGELGKDGDSAPNNYNVPPFNGGSSGIPPTDY